MVCRYYIHKDSETGKFYLHDESNPEQKFYLRTDCGEAPIAGDCDPCSLNAGLCLCYPMETNSNVTLIGTAPPEFLPIPTSGYFMPRYARVALLGSPAIRITNQDDRDPSTLWEIWTPSEACDEDVDTFGDPGNVSFNSFAGGIELRNPDGPYELTNSALSLSWNGNGWDINVQFSYQSPVESPTEFCSGGLVGNNRPLQVRFRREYEDFVTKEQQQQDVAQICDVVASTLLLDITFEPTCRPPATGIFCNCVDESYNVIDLNTLDTYDAPVVSGCSGVPIDIDTDCGDVSSVTTWKMYYAPYENTVPVIDFVAYDTTNIPDDPGVEVVLIGEFATQEEARSFTCTRLRFGTIGAGWPGDPNDIEYDWPYNDLYFNACGGTEGSINLIPC